MKHNGGKIIYYTRVMVHLISNTFSSDKIDEINFCVLTFFFQFSHWNRWESHNYIEFLVNMSATFFARVEL